MRTLYNLGLFFKAGVLLLFLAGCGAEDTDKDGTADDIDKCQAVAGPRTNEGCPIVPQIKKIHLYLDNSASMGGYYRDQTEYKTIITDLAVKMDKEIKPIDISFIADTTLPYKKSVADFTSALATTPMAAQKSSELHRMIRNIAEHCGDHDVSLLVSDCILSFPDKDIKVNPNINRDNAGSTLKNNVYATFADLRKKGFAVSVYGFKSRFFGIYYNDRNQKTKLNGTLRPFYIWVIARQSFLLRFNAQLEQISSFRPEHALHFGLVDKPVTTFNILPEMQRKGDWAKSGSGVSDVDLPKGQSLQIGVVLNLDDLPSYARTDGYLRNNLIIKANGCTARFEIGSKTEADKARLHSESQINAFENASHELIVKVSDMSLSQADIHFNLPLKFDTWYQDWSTMNDQDITLQGSKTFALEYLIGGVKEAYETPNKNFIDFSLLLTK